MPDVIYLVCRRPPRLIRQSVTYTWQEYVVGAVWVGMTLVFCAVVWWGIFGVVSGIVGAVKHIWG